MNCEMQELGESGEFGDLELVDTDISLAVEKSESLVKTWISKFFVGKTMYCGGNLSERVLLSAKYVRMVLEIQLSLAVDIVYAAWKKDRGAPFAIPMGGISDDVKWVMAFLHHCALQRVPPAFIGGLMLIYLEQCEGISIPNGLF